MRSHTFAWQAEARIRERRKLSQRELARRVPVHQTYLSLIESGKRQPSYAVAEAICRALEVDIEELIRPKVVA